MYDNYICISNNTLDMKAIALVRVSTAVQDLQQQTDAVMKEMMKDGYEKDDIIPVNNTESAVKLSEEERQGLNTMKSLMKKGGCPKPQASCSPSSGLLRNKKGSFEKNDSQEERRKPNLKVNHSATGFRSDTQLTRTGI